MSAVNNFKIRFAPLNVPMFRRRQTVGVLLFVMMLPLSFALFVGFLYYTTTRPLVYAYLAYVLLDTRGAEGGARRSEFFRSLVIWKWMVCI